MENPYQNEEEYNEQFNRSGLTDIRRKYPFHPKGGKSEWSGMIQHQSLINEELAKTEKGIKVLKLKALMNDYERQQLELLQRRQALLNQKKLDFVENLRNKQLYDEQCKIAKENTNFLKNGLAQRYSEDIHMKHEAKQYFRTQEIDLEQKILEDNRKKIVSEERKRNEKKEREKQMCLEQIEANRQRKVDQLIVGQKFKTEINELQKNNALKEQMKEDNYKNFFKNRSDFQNKFISLHKSQVLDPRNEKQRYMDDIISKNVNEERVREIQREMERNSKKQGDIKKVASSNVYLMTEHELKKNGEKEEKKNQNSKRLEELNAYNDYLKFKHQEKNSHVNEYKAWLDKQHQEKDSKILNQFRMNKNEKQLNYFDLQAFKGADPSLFSMIPGWSPQVGVLPPFKKLEGSLPEINNLSQIQNTNEDPSNPSPPSLKKQPFFSSNVAVTSLAGNMNQGKYQPQFQSNLKGNFEVKSPLALQTNINTQILNNVDKMGTDFISTKDNILNNGNGGNISNPYILKEFQKNRNIFTKVGQDSLSK